MTTAQVAEYLRVSVPTVNRLAAAGSLRTLAQLPGVRGARVYDRTDVEAFAATREKESA